MYMINYCMRGSGIKIYFLNVLNYNVCMAMSEITNAHIELDQYMRFKKLIRKYNIEYSHRIKDLSNNDK